MNKERRENREEKIENRENRGKKQDSRSKSVRTVILSGAKRNRRVRVS